MTGSVALDVAIGLLFIYLLYSLLATIIQEIIATFFSLRASNLEKAITRMLEDGSKNKNIVQAFYKHPIIKFLGEDERNKKKPSYLKADTFSKVIIDLLKGNSEEALKPGTDIRPLIQQAIDKGMIAWNTAGATSADAARIEKETILYLRSIWADAQGDVDRFRSYLENWFEETMDRASGWYKKRTQRILFFIGLVLAASFNVNTIDIVKKLEKDPELRTELVTQADAFTKAHPNLDKELMQEKKEDVVMVQKDTTGRTSLKTLDSLNEAQYEKDTAKRNMLVKQATEIVTKDISSTNHILGLGWTQKHFEEEIHQSPKEIAVYFGLSLLGWIITALAISLGAPFWFDLLNKMMQLRSSTTTGSDNNNSQQQQGNTPAVTVNRKG